MASPTTDGRAETLPLVEENGSNGNRDGFIGSITTFLRERRQSTIEGIDGLRELPQEDPALQRQPVPEAEILVDEELVAEIRRQGERYKLAVPFVVILLLYFFYMHSRGIALSFVGTVAIWSIDQKVREQVALKENAKTKELLYILLYTGPHLYLLYAIEEHRPSFLYFLKQIGTLRVITFADVIWINLVNDFIIRLIALMLKTILTFSCCYSTTTTDREGECNTPTRYSVKFRRKRKIYALMEYLSIFARKAVASYPWVQFYASCSDPFVKDSFALLYVFCKATALTIMGTQILSLMHSIISVQLEYGTYVTQEEAVESGSSDCPICYTPFRCAVKLPCQHIFCEYCAGEWFDRELTCPICRAAVSSRPNTPRPVYLNGETDLVPQLL